MKANIPKEVRAVAGLLEQAGFEAHLVGGCVRDLILSRTPKDWDVATNAKPDKVQEIFRDFADHSAEDPGTVYENEFGTVGVKAGSEDPTLRLIEVTTYRTEKGYADKRRPDEVSFVTDIKEDLARRDFTMNAIALRIIDGEISEEIDPFGGRSDIAAGVIRTVGIPEERFGEDALRLMRAVRFAAELGFEIEPATRAAIGKLSGELAFIAKERVRDEFTKLIMSPNPAKGILLLEQTGLLAHILPELREGLGVSQNKHHIYGVFEHLLRSLEYAASQNYSLEIRLASLLHDVGKPRSKAGEGEDSTFYNHEYIGAKMAARALERLKFSRSVADHVVHLVRYHMFYYNVGEISEAGVRRFVARVGVENLDDLLKVREADRIGSGVPKAVPYKIRHLQFMIDKVRRDPISPKMLKINGERVMELTALPPSRTIGEILAILLEEVLDDPARNTQEYLEKRAIEVAALDSMQRAALTERAKKTQEEFEEEAEGELKSRHRVQ
jgi:putative nucleotidyltransferase with HDIG domain